MSLIALAAYLAMCRCGIHGRIILSDGSKSEIFATKKRGYALAEELRASGKMSEEELRAVRDQIERTELVYEDKALESDIAALTLVSTTLGFTCLFSSSRTEEYVH